MGKDVLINVSWIGSYVYCPRKFFIENILGIRPEIKPEPLILGTIVHEVLDRTTKNESNILKTINSIDKESIERTYSDFFLQTLKEVILDQKGVVLTNGYSTIQAFDKVWRIIINEARERAQEVHKVAERHGVAGEEILSYIEPIVFSEKRFESKELMLKGKIDKLEVYSNNLAVPIEFKTGASPYNGLHLSHKLQVAAYLMLLREEGFKIKYGLVKYVKENKVMPVTLTKELENKVIEMRDKIIELLEDLKMPDFCDNKEVCITRHLKDLPKNKEEILAKFRA